MKKDNLLKWILRIITFILCFITPLIYILLVIKETKCNVFVKMFRVLFGSRLITFGNTGFLKMFKIIEEPEKYFKNMYTSSLIAYLIVFAYLLYKTCCIDYLLVIFLIAYDFVSDYLGLVSFAWSKLKEDVCVFFRTSENITRILGYITVILFIILEQFFI